MAGRRDGTELGLGGGVLTVPGGRSEPMPPLRPPAIGTDNEASGFQPARRRGANRTASTSHLAGSINHPSRPGWMLRKQTPGLADPEPRQSGPDNHSDVTVGEIARIRRSAGHDSGFRTTIRTDDR